MSRTLEITVISAENLQVNQKSIKKNLFVSVQTDPSNICATKMHTEDGSYPSWNEKLKLDMPFHASFLTAEVKCKTSMGIKSVGLARIPASDFIGGYVPENQLHFLSYRLWDSRVNRNGIINVSIRVKSPEYSCLVSQPAPVEGVPMAGHSPAGVVTGIPVCSNYQRNF